MKWEVEIRRIAEEECFKMLFSLPVASYYRKQQMESYLHVIIRFTYVK